MLKELFINIFLRRHRFWRFASFSEIGELYTVKMMRTIGFYVGASFMSVYMLKSGYSVVDISLFWAGYFALKVVMILPLAKLIADIGPKKAVIISNFLYIPSMISFIFLPQFGLWSLLITGSLQAISAALYNMGYTITFSRVKNPEKAGRQVASMNIAEKIAKGVSPLIGGLLAMFFDPRASIVVSTIFFILAAWPLLRTKDTMQTGFKLIPKKFPWKQAKSGLMAQLPLGFDIYASGIAWSIFLASLIFTTDSNQVYAELGALTSLILAVSLISTYAYGKLIDRRAGGQLLYWAAIGSVVVDIFRILVRTPAMAVGTNAAKEVMMTGYSMAFMRGMLDEADRSGYRVLYVCLSNLIANLGSLAAALILAGAVAMFHTAGGFTIFYLVAAAVISLLTLTKFRLYRLR